MIEIFLNISNFIIRICFTPTEYIFPQKKILFDIQQNYKGFISSKKYKEVDYSIYFTGGEFIERLSKKKRQQHFLNFYEFTGKNEIITFYHISIIQLQVILNIIIQKLLARSGGFMMHSSAVDIKREAYIFLGPSGAGKSTAMILLSSKYTPLADDSIILKKENNKFYFFQTPFIEKEYRIIKDQAKYSLGKIFILKKADYFRIAKITDKGFIYRLMMEQLLTEKLDLKNQIKYILEFTRTFNEFYYLYFMKDRRKLINLLTS